MYWRCGTGVHWTTKSCARTGCVQTERSKSPFKVVKPQIWHSSCLFLYTPVSWDVASKKSWQYIQGQSTFSLKIKCCYVFLWHLGNWSVSVPNSVDWQVCWSWHIFWQCLVNDSAWVKSPAIFAGCQSCVYHLIFWQIRHSRLSI